ncbi:hypothetical protein ACIA8O_36625 [Kitasatospora sp. NPDC051853]|uniref:hypothetical protein n=1 Tax=Kitasatospora sp. NPDC051853 TaxID=3364058 RepID=UPI0037B9F9C7
MTRFDVNRPNLPWCVAALVATLALLHMILSSAQPHLPMGHPDHCRTVVTAVAAPTGEEDGAADAAPRGDRPVRGQCAVDTHKGGRHSSPQVRAVVSTVAVGVTTGAEQPRTRYRAPGAPRPVPDSSTILRC